jgi:hypothetical protein
MSEICPKCGAANRAGRSTCAVCGAELEIASFAEMFGPPRQLRGRYLIQGALQQGTKLSLYRAVDTEEGNRPCLVHQVTPMLPDLREQEELEYRFAREAAAWKARQHPNIIRILDADVQHHRLYLVTEPVKGVSLRSIIQDRRQAVSEPTLLYWAGQLCDALVYLHSQSPSVVLGCLSPSTIHVDQGGRIQLVEVGLIRYDRSGLLGSARGVPGYAAPEQRRGELTPRSDLYSLGIILYQVITRFDPKERPLPSLHKYASGISEPVVEAITRAYRRDPEKRFASADEMRQVLLGTSIQSAFELAPLAIAGGKVVTTIPDMVRFCAAHWDEGLLALVNNSIAEWLTESARALHQAGQDQAADGVEQAAHRTVQAGEQMAIASARPGMEEIAHNMAFAAWLKDMGAMGIQPSLHVQPDRFDFGVVGPTVKAKSALQIRNKGRGYLTGRVESALPWLTIPNPVFGCRAGETARVAVEARGRRLPPGDSSSAQAIRVTSDGGDAWIEAWASSSPPVLDVQPRTLNYGLIARGASRVAHLVLWNRGGGRLNGRVSTKAPWLRIRHPQFSCPASASAQIAVELLSVQLPKRAVRIRRALIVDSDSGQAQIDIAWKWARPGLELDTTGLDMGSVERGTRVRRTLNLFNSGTADLIGKAESRVTWLAVDPAEFQCVPGDAQLLSVTCDTSMLPGGSTVEAEAIEIGANAGTQTLSASVEVLAPELIVQTPEIDLGTVRDGDQVEETIMIGNRGSLPWEGFVRANVPWLTVEPEEVRCEPGHFMPVTAMLDTTALEAGGKWTVPDAVQIEERGQGGLASPHFVSVHVTLSRPRLMVERHSLDFGLIGRTDIVTLPLEVTNGGTGELQWRIESRGTWVEVIPEEGVCQAGETTAVQVNAYALAVDGESGRAWLTVRSNGGRVDLPASVSLSSPLLVVDPSWLDLKSDNYDPASPGASQTIRVSNRGVGNLTGRVTSQVSWLICDQAFECATGVSTQISAQANPEGLREGTYEAIDALRVESNATSQEIGARLTVTLTPQLYVATQALHFDDVIDQSVADQKIERSFQLENRGYATLRAQVLPVEEWIAVNRRDWTIKPGKKVRVRVSLIDAPPDADGKIEIRAPGQTMQLSVRRTARTT